VQACSAAHPLEPRRTQELVAARPARPGIERSLARELNPATLGTRPRAGPSVREVERIAQRNAATRPSVLYGEVKTRQNDVLEIGPWRTRPARHVNKRKITVRGSESRLSERLMNICQQRRCSVVARRRPRPRPVRAASTESGEEHLIVLCKIHMATVESACARVDRAQVRGVQGSGRRDP
jgi:hypothetical protein